MKGVGTEKYNYTMTALLSLKKNKLGCLRGTGSGATTRQAISFYTAVFSGLVCDQ